MQDVYYHFRIVILLFIYRHCVIKYKKRFTILGEQAKKENCAVYLNKFLFVSEIHPYHFH